MSANRYNPHALAVNEGRIIKMIIRRNHPPAGENVMAAARSRDAAAACVPAMAADVGARVVSNQYRRAIIVA